MSETYDIVKALEFSEQYEVNCELTPKQCKWILGQFEKYQNLQSYVFKLDKIEFELKQRITELESELNLLKQEREYLSEYKVCVDQLTAHSDIERQDDKSPNNTQTQTIVYGKEDSEVQE